MKKVCVLILVAAFIMVAPAFAAETGQKGASAQALQKASPQSVMNRATDWFATRGKSPEQRDAILAEREAIRAQKRAQKEAEKAQKAAEKQMKQAQKQLQETKEMVKKQAKGMGK